MGKMFDRMKAAGAKKLPAEKGPPLPARATVPAPEKPAAPPDLTFASVNDFVHDPDQHFEHLQWLCLTLAAALENAGGAPAPPSVVWKCRCVAGLDHFAARNCPACKRKFKREKNDRRKSRRESEKPTTASMGQEGRLPDGANFNLTYLAGRVVWLGTLTVPVPGAEPLVFHGTGTGLFRAEKDLDRAYRESLLPAAGIEPSEKGNEEK